MGPACYSAGAVGCKEWNRYMAPLSRGCVFCFTHAIIPVIGSNKAG